jgi:hypothetical protein
MSTALALLRGVAVASVTAALVFALVVILGAVTETTGFVFLAGAALGATIGLTPRAGPGAALVGSLLVGATALAAGVATGFGWLEYSVIAGSAVAAVWLITGEPLPSKPGLWFAWGGVFLGFLVLVLLPLVLDGGTLGHDESAYAVKSREWLEGTPGTGWNSHRGIGMSVYGYGVLAAGGGEPGLRLIGLLGALGLTAGVWALGRRISGPTAGALAALGMIAGPAFLYRSTEYLSDVPSAALLVGCMVIVWREFHDRELPTYGLLWALPLAWGSFYLRYQASLSLALIAGVTLSLWWSKIRRRPRPVVWLIVIGGLGLVPHFVQSMVLTGSVFGIILDTGQAAVLNYVGEGLGDYLGQLPWALAGYAGPIALVAALVGTALAWRRRELRVGYLFLLVPALAQVIALGLISRGEPRFLFFPIALVMVAGATSFEYWVVRAGRPWSRALNWALCVILIGSLALSAAAARRSVSNRISSNEPVELAADLVAAESSGVSCGVMTSYDPQITFYSACATEVFRPSLEAEEALGGLTGEAKFMVLVEDGKRQPTGSHLHELVTLTEGPPTIVDGATRDAAVYRFAG